MKKFIIFICLFFVFCFKVYASHLDLYRIDGVYSSQLNLDNGSYYSFRQNVYYVDGRVVYCVEPGIDITTREYDSVSDLNDSGYSSSILNRISMIGYFGYDYPGHYSSNYFLAAQELIWETIGNNEVHFTTGINGSGNVVDIESEKNEIISLINSYDIKPSFDGGSFSGVFGDKLILSDSNNILSNYSVLSGDAYIDGNDLVINLGNLGNNRITLIRNKYDDLNSVFYFADSSQNFMFLRAYDVISYVDVNSFIPYSNVKVIKTGPVLSGFDDEFIYTDDYLDNVIFDLYAADDIYIGDEIVYSRDQLVDSFVTDGGYALSIDLPNGNYYLKESSTLDEYILSDDIYNIELDNSFMDVYTYMIDIHNERKNVSLSLVKHGESFDDSNTIPLEGVCFGLYSSNDIYKDDELLIGKDELIKSFLTDSNGEIADSLDVPFGTYYLKELETLPGYKLDESIYEFSVSGNDSSDINILISKEPIINKIIRGSLVIKKVDEFGNGLYNVGFRLFDSNDNLVFDGYTNTDGILSIDSLPYGQYYFYEYSTPFGYISDDTLYDINIFDDESVVCVDVVNYSYPVTSDIYLFPRKLSLVGLSFGLCSLSLGVFYDKKYKNC